MVRLGDVEETIPLRGEENDEKARRRHGSRKLRSRPTPKWIMTSKDLDKVAQQRCLMVLSVLSGEMPVTEAISQAGISRGTYYQLETRALSAMLRALGPLAGEDGTENSPLRQIAALEAKVRELERSRRRTQRLLLMTRRVVLGKEKRIGSTRAWQRSFEGLETEEATEEDRGSEPAFSPGDDWRGRALTWERKLSGADEASHGKEELHGDAEGPSGDRDALRDGDGGALGGAERERGREASGSLPESLPDPACTARRR